MSHFTAIAAPALLLAATSAMANELPSRQFPEKSAIESSTRPCSDIAPVRIAQLAKEGAGAAKKSAAATPPATADVKTADGKDVGTVTLTQTRAGVRLSGTLKGLPPGERALHVHSVGKCEPPFTSAGPHFNPAQKKHGKLNPEGHHAGDMDNITV
ncbi:MAG: superoxide dismutase, Cu-Zn family, partial [Alphaproteobacteria bacterium]|nr:superoxide dismutase, Cu-Zn family [Alphaproteobacteria bacterium]